jgi:hypothetical protein
LALNLEYEFTYADKPVLPVRIINAHDGQFKANTEALVDTGADMSLFDAELGLALSLRARGSLAGHYNIIGIGGGLHRIPCWWVHLSILGGPETFSLKALKVGFVPGLAKTVGNLLGRDFLELVDLGLHHHPLPSRRLYLGSAWG